MSDEEKGVEVTDPYRTAASTDALRKPEATRHVAELPQWKRAATCPKCGSATISLKYKEAFKPPTDRDWAHFLRYLNKTLGDLNGIPPEYIDEQWAIRKGELRDSLFDLDSLEAWCSQCGYKLGRFRCVDYTED